jgi:hypothetical protein
MILRRLTCYVTGAKRTVLYTKPSMLRYCILEFPQKLIGKAIIVERSSICSFIFVENVGCQPWYTVDEALVVLLPR